MKKLIAALFLMPVAVTAQQKGFVITGTITGLPENSKVSLVDMSKPTDTLAKGQVAKETFVLKGTVAEANLYQLNFDVATAGKKTVLFIGNDNVTLKGDIKNVQQFEVKGSPTHADFVEFQKTF